MVTNKVKNECYLIRQDITIYKFGLVYYVSVSMLYFMFEISITHFVLYWFQPVLHDWCNKGCGMCYPVCGMMHIK